MERFQGGFIFEEEAELQSRRVCVFVRARVRDGDIEAEMEREV